MNTPTRNRETNGTQSLVRTLLGDYTWADAGGPIPAGVFTRVLAEFGISDMAARLALERVAGHGFLMRDMLGRAVLYRLSDWALSHHQERFARLKKPWPATRSSASRAAMSEMPNSASTRVKTPAGIGPPASAQV
jgi:DNA-binding transcriptional regulator PaaX